MKDKYDTIEFTDKFLRSQLQGSRLCHLLSMFKKASISARLPLSPPCQAEGGRLILDYIHYDIMLRGATGKY